jgi:uncharacterized protein YjbJ (UPF0337 family)
MNHQVKGKVENLKGRVKQAAGSLTGNKELEAKGAAQRGKGAAQELAGKVQNKMQNAADRAEANVDEDEELEAERRARYADESLRGGRGNA